MDKNYDDLIVSFLRAKINPYLIMLFGSINKDYFRNDSDIDIAFLSDCNLSQYDIFMLAQDLADILKRDVDLIDLNKASTVFKVQVISTGRIIYSSDEYRRANFMIRALKEYALLNEERKIVLDNIFKGSEFNG
ncbi:type VII toxin-antitoxin system MntA family adenylyltransferase antitoxin [Caloramator australicus]|uniref:DNA polymerase, beta domain protein region n=1 Tax=Caloramator australicus RC3 TaxID=857293 RepID=I7J4P6_9CLOT|nr:nucleotidyltransferase domain-containing protein [Caloramator australicus]CCJ32831.1 DNA polymerase, beta domain protein region [Caloramator australicus RC3]